MSALTVAFILDFVILLAFGAYIYQTTRKSKPSAKIEKAQEKSYQLLHSAIRQASQIVEQAQRDSEYLENELKDSYQDQSSTAKQLFESELKDFTTKLNAAQQEYLNFLNEMKQRSSQTQEDSLQAVKQNTTDLFLKFEQSLSDFLSQTREQSTSSIELELQATRQMIETYRQQQLKLIDENIIAMLERTLSLVLPKKLTLGEQTELIYESLEKAKAEKFIS